MESTNGQGPKRVVLYARVSTDEQANFGYSLAQQIEALRAHAAREGFRILEEVTDPGQGSFRQGACLPLPAPEGVRGARDKDPRSERPRRREPRGGAH